MVSHTHGHMYPCKYLPVKLARGSQELYNRTTSESFLENITSNQNTAENIPMISDITNGTFFKKDFLPKPYCLLGKKIIKNLATKKITGSDFVVERICFQICHLLSTTSCILVKLNFGEIRRNGRQSRLETLRRRVVIISNVIDKLFLCTLWELIISQH